MTESTEPKAAAPKKKAAPAKKEKVAPRINVPDIIVDEVAPLTDIKEVASKVEPFQVDRSGYAERGQAAATSNPNEDQKLSSIDQLLQTRKIAAALPTPENPNAGKVIKTIHKLERMKNRLGLQNVKDKDGFVPQMMPGSTYMWEPSVKNGGVYLTGLEDKPEIRKRLEEVMGVSLAPTAPFYGNLRYRLEDKPQGNIMNLSDANYGAYNEAIYYAMTVSPLICNGREQYRDGTKPFAEWFIEDTEADAETNQKLYDIEQQVYGAFRDMTEDRKRNIARILELKGVYGVSPKVISSKLWAYIKLDPKNLVSFMRVMEMQPDEFGAHLVWAEAIKYAVIKMDMQRNYTFRGTVLGATKDQVISLLQDFSKQNIHISIKDDLRIKKETSV